MNMIVIQAERGAVLLHVLISNMTLDAWRLQPVACMHRDKEWSLDGKAGRSSVTEGI